MMVHLLFEVTGKECVDEMGFLNGVTSLYVGKSTSEFESLVAGTDRELVLLIGFLEESGTFVVEGAVFSKLGAVHLGVGGNMLLSFPKAVSLALTRLHHRVPEVLGAGVAFHEVAVLELHPANVLLHVDAVEDGA
jgi:hypothetical protein